MLCIESINRARSGGIASGRQRILLVAGQGVSGYQAAVGNVSLVGNAVAVGAQNAEIRRLECKLSQGSAGKTGGLIAKQTTIHGRCPVGCTVPKHWRVHQTMRCWRAVALREQAQKPHLLLPKRVDKLFCVSKRVHAILGYVGDDHLVGFMYVCHDFFSLLK